MTTEKKNLTKSTKLYTVGEIFSQGLMLTFNGTPHRSKNYIAVYVKEHATFTKLTPWGEARALTEKQIREYNRAQQRFFTSKPPEGALL